MPNRPDNSLVVMLAHLPRPVQRRLLLCALPRLAELHPGEWRGALQRAREVGFDAFERAGVLVSLAVAAYLLRFNGDEGVLLPLSVRYLAQFLAAMPLLVLLAGGFYLRSIRRGLSFEIDCRAVRQSFGTEKSRPCA